jgi:hypothetical protein
MPIQISHPRTAHGCAWGRGGGPSVTPIFSRAQRGEYWEELSTKHTQEGAREEWSNFNNLVGEGGGAHQAIWNSAQYQFPGKSSRWGKRLGIPGVNEFTIGHGFMRELRRHRFPALRAKRLNDNDKSRRYMCHWWALQCQSWTTPCLVIDLSVKFDYPFKLVYALSQRWSNSIACAVSQKGKGLGVAPVPIQPPRALALVAPPMEGTMQGAMEIYSHKAVVTWWQLHQSNFSMSWLYTNFVCELSRCMLLGHLVIYHFNFCVPGPRHVMKDTKKDSRSWEI